MAGLGPAIHDLRAEGAMRGRGPAHLGGALRPAKAWVPGPSPGMTVEGVSEALGR
jgi:hypothetical protein